MTRKRFDKQSPAIDGDALEQHGSEQDHELDAEQELPPESAMPAVPQLSPFEAAVQHAGLQHDYKTASARAAYEANQAVLGLCEKQEAYGNVYYVHPDLAGRVELLQVGGAVIISPRKAPAT